MRLFNREYSRAEVEQMVGDIGQLCGIQSMRCHDGLETGTRVLRLWNADGLQLDLIPDRSMDLGRLFYKGIPLTWSSGTGYVNPAYLQDRGWPGGFHGGLLATCGLNNVGPSCDEDGEWHEQHGRISRLPAQRVTYETAWQGEQPRLEAQGVVEDRTSKGYHMQLVRRVSVDGDRSRIRLRDQVTNLGLAEEVCMIQYHMNFGFPLVVEDAELVVPDASRDRITRLSALTPEVAVQYIERSVAPSRMGEVSIKCPSIPLELTIRYSAETLPHLWRWHDFRRGMRVFAIEPSNCRVKPRSQAREAGCLPVLEPGESRTFEIEIEMTEI